MLKNSPRLDCSAGSNRRGWVGRFFSQTLIKMKSNKVKCFKNIDKSKIIFNR